MLFMKFIFLKKKRLPLVLFNSLYAIANLLWTVIISFLIIKWASVDLWGEFMTLAALIMLGNHFVKWGNKTYLLKEFSAKPASIKTIWNAVFIARLPLFLIVFLAATLYYLNKPMLMVLIGLWLLSDYISSSFEAHLIYFKKFKRFFLIEIGIIPFAIIVLYLFKENLSLFILVIIYAGRICIKALGALIVFKKSYLLKFYRPSYKLLKKVSPFFLIGLIGMLNSKIDFYSVLYFMSDTDIGKYHILSNFVLFGITIGSFIIIPFEKNIYRLSTHKVNKIALNFFTLGLFISSLWMGVSKLFITTFYQIEFPLIYYAIGILYILPIYYYWPILHKLYAADKTKSALKVGLISVLINAIFNILLIPIYGILGALISTTLGQIVLLIGYISISKKNE